MKNTLYIYLFIALFLFSCSKNRQSEIVTIEPSIVLDVLSDSSFFKDVMYMNVKNNDVYASDSYNGRIIKMDKNLNLLSIMGKNGRGPGEFSGVGSSILLNDTLYAIDFGLRLNAFNLNGMFVGSYKFSDPTITMSNFCTDNEGYLFFSSVIDSLPIVKYDRFMNRISSFGSWVGEKDNRQATNHYLLQNINGMIMTVSSDAPIFYFYDKNGELVFKKIFDSELFESRLAFKDKEINKDSKNRLKTYQLFTSITSFNNKIYLLYIDHNPSNGLANSNKIVELIYNKNDLKIGKVYQLDKQGWFTSIVYLADNKILCFNATKSAFYIYKLK